MTEILSKKDAYLAMFSFLEEYYIRTGSDDIGSLLGEMCLTDNGMPVESACWDEWKRSLQKALNNEVDAEMRLSDGTLPST